MTTDLHLLSAQLCSGVPFVCMDADDMLDLLNVLNLGAVTPQRCPLEPGWQLACSGLYELDLSLQVCGQLAPLGHLDGSNPPAELCYAAQLSIDGHLSPA